MVRLVHMAPTSRLDAILSEGLRTAMPVHLTDCGTWAHAYYGTNPVFLSEDDSDYLQAVRDHAEGDFVVLDVDASGLALVADLPSLCDTGAMLEDGVLWWREGRVPPPLGEFVDEGGAIEIEYLVDPATDVCRAAIRTTRTAACLSDIPPARLAPRASTPAPAA